MAVTLYCFGNNNKKEKFVHFQYKYFFSDIFDLLFIECKNMESADALSQL